MFQLVKSSEMPKLTLLECLPLLIQCGTEHTHVATEFPDYLPNVVTLVEQEHQIKAQHQVVVMVYELVKHVSGRHSISFAPSQVMFLFSNQLQCIANHRIAICRFTEDVLCKLIKIYNHRLDDATKLVLFKVFHLSIVSHFPRLHADASHTFNADRLSDVPVINYIQDIQIWHKQLRNMFSIVENEIKESDRSYGRHAAPNLSQTFVGFAATLCSVVIRIFVIRLRCSSQ